MRKICFSSVVKFVAFMATFANEFGNVSPNGSENASTSNGKAKGKNMSRMESCSLIIVSTLDGKLSALDGNNNGDLKWSLPAFSGPLLSSSLSSFQTGNKVRVIPSLDGGLYRVAGDTIESIPYTADSLLGSFHKLQDGSMLVGGKEAISCGIDPYTGKVRYICSAEGCKLSEDEENGHVQNKDVLVVKRTQQTVRAVDQRTGSERWNFSVGQQDVNFLEGIGEEGDNKCAMPDAEVSTEWDLRISIPDGLIAAVQPQASGDIANEVVLWSHKFEAPIAAIWTLHGDYLKSVDLFSDEIMPGLRDGLPNQDTAEAKPIMYLGSHEGQVYIQPSHPIINTLDPAIKIHSQTNDGSQRKPRTISWQPKLATSASRTPTVVSKEVAVWNPVEYPFDNGYYFYGDVQPVIPPHHRALPNGHGTDNQTINNKDNKKPPPNSHAMEYWKGAMAVVVVFAAFAQLVLKFLVTPAKPLSPSSASLSLNASFSSRYLTDFEHELCLGKGGFGLVFQARNKVDDCQYAIKRVRLPNCDEARAKVMREVKALAKLEHSGIVRYFNAWFEAPPVGWQEELDEKMVDDGKYCGIGDDVLSTGGLVMHDISHHDNIYKQKAPRNGLISDPDGKKIRQRKSTSSSSKSHHSDCTSAEHNRHNTITEDLNLDIPFDVQQLENEAFLPEDESGSFGIEFAESSGSHTSPGQSSHVGVKDVSESSGIVFKHSSNGGAAIPVRNSSKSSCSRGSHSSTDSDSHISPSFTTSGQSLLSGKHHKCGNKNCTSDILSAPLYLYIQMQLCQRESLKDWLKNNSTREDIFCFNVFEQIVNAVEYFHNRGMMHRDLKPSNIFFSLDGLVKVGDFGLVTATKQDNIHEIQETDNPGDLDGNHTGQVGTQLYMSPEQIEGKAYSFKVDIFSLGLILFELFHPFSTEMERIKVMSNVKKRIMPAEFKTSMTLQSQLVTWMTSDLPTERPTAAEIQSSDIYKNIITLSKQGTKVKSE
ncbi:predicted protein [Nematostella vectensis]|uniref:non-specific serine/threonine protein kinase n=1 Tax=Nematostella vectensis TaxID=45351 RepID=A7RIC0_NEMVE|nr:predicted protein [Nematostella vectensis]|eukprot:XP_001640848.1 predicted protein [Nematostella vectensis]